MDDDDAYEEDVLDEDLDDDEMTEREDGFLRGYIGDYKEDSSDFEEDDIDEAFE